MRMIFEFAAVRLPSERAVSLPNLAACGRSSALSRRAADECSYGSGPPGNFDGSLARCFGALSEPRFDVRVAAVGHPAWAVPDG